MLPENCRVVEVEEVEVDEFVVVEAGRGICEDILGSLFCKFKPFKGCVRLKSNRDEKVSLDKVFINADLLFPQNPVAADCPCVYHLT